MTREPASYRGNDTLLFGIWGSVIVGLSIGLLMPTNLLLGQYMVLAVVAYTLFGLGLAFYATPSTDAALSNLPDDQPAPARHLQNGLITRRLVRRRDLSRHLYRAQR
jgi:hypothetical protein